VLGHLVRSAWRGVCFERHEESALEAARITTRHRVRPVVQLLATFSLVTFMLTVGLGTTRGSVRRELGHVGLLGRSLLSTLVVVPLLAVVAVRWLALGGNVAAAIVIVSTAAGAPFVVAAARLARGSVPFAIALTLALGLLTAFTAPATIHLFLPSARAHLSTASIFARLLALQVLPLVAGIAIRDRSRGTAATLARVTTVLFVVPLLGVIAVVIVPRLARLALLGWRGVFAVVVTTLATYGFAWWLGGPSTETRTSLALVSNARNIALAMLLAASAFHDRELIVVVVAVWLVRTLMNVAFVQIARRLPHRKHDAFEATGAVHP
jgi:predicted Na+-dependent transporter